MCSGPAPYRAGTSTSARAESGAPELSVGWLLADLGATSLGCSAAYARATRRAIRDCSASCSPGAMGSGDGFLTKLNRFPLLGRASITGSPGYVPACCLTNQPARRYRRTSARRSSLSSPPNPHHAPPSRNAWVGQALFPQLRANRLQAGCRCRSSPEFRLLGVVNPGAGPGWACRCQPTVAARARCQTMGDLSRALQTPGRSDVPRGRWSVFVDDPA